MDINKYKWIDLKNTNQREWISNYLKKKGTLIEPQPGLATTPQDIILFIRKLPETAASAESLARMEKAWRAHKRRAKNKTSITNSNFEISSKTKSKLTQLSRQTGLSQNKVLEELINEKHSESGINKKLKRETDQKFNLMTRLYGLKKDIEDSKNKLRQEKTRLKETREKLKNLEKNKRLLTELLYELEVLFDKTVERLENIENEEQPKGIKTIIRKQIEITELKLEKNEILSRANTQQTDKPD